MLSHYPSHVHLVTHPWLHPHWTINCMKVWGVYLSSSPQNVSVFVARKSWARGPSGGQWKWVCSGGPEASGPCRPPGCRDPPGISDPRESCSESPPSLGRALNAFGEFSEQSVQLTPGLGLWERSACHFALCSSPNPTVPLQYSAPITPT